MNWKNLIADLIDTGMTQTEIAARLNITQPSVNEILRSPDRKSVRWETGDALIRLHKRVMRKVA